MPISSSILRPCWHKGVLAPTEAQRLKYTQHMIIWGKPAVMYPKRVIDLANTYNVSFCMGTEFHI